MFEAAYAEAEKSTFDHFKIGCVITYKNKIIGSGYNDDKTHPLQQRYNELYRDFNTNNGNFVKHSIHAEISAISSIPYVVGKEADFNKAKIFVYRICPGKPRGYGNAKPCEACIHAIADMGIRDVFFTDDDGLSYLRLDY